MNQSEFIPFHNKHIKFRMKNSSYEFSGVLVDNMKGSSVYSFISSKNIKKWQLAVKNGDNAKKKSLETYIDITNIEWAERIFPKVMKSYIAGFWRMRTKALINFPSLVYQEVKTKAS